MDDGPLSRHPATRVVRALAIVLLAVAVLAVSLSRGTAQAPKLTPERLVSIAAAKGAKAARRVANRRACRAGVKEVTVQIQVSAGDATSGLVTVVDVRCDEVEGGR